MNGKVFFNKNILNRLRQCGSIDWTKHNFLLLQEDCETHLAEHQGSKETETYCTTTITDLFIVWDLYRRAVVGLLEEDLFHLARLQVVQLSHSIFGALDQVNKHRLWPFTLDKCMLHMAKRDQHTRIRCLKRN